QKRILAHILFPPFVGVCVSTPSLHNCSRIRLFGSVARDETETDSDIDLAAEFDPAARMDLLQLTALERRNRRATWPSGGPFARTGRETPLAGSDQPGPPPCLLAQLSLLDADFAVFSGFSARKARINKGR